VRRRIFNFCAGLSLLLFAAICTFWVGSHWLKESLQWAHGNGVQWVETLQGHLALGVFAGDYSSQPPYPYRLKYTRDEPAPPFNSFIFLNTEVGDSFVEWERYGFAWYSIRNTRLRTVHAQVVAPFWSVAALATVLPLAWTTKRWSPIPPTHAHRPLPLLRL
jgi:hypothetical protein